MSLRTTIAVTVGLALAAVSCAVSDGADGGDPGRVSVVATTTQLADFARRIGGDQVNVYGVLKANVDPHDYEPSPADLDSIARADVIVKNGVGLEKWFDDTIRSAEPRGEIVDASSGVTIRRGNGTGEQADGDPHIWHDPLNAIVMATNLEAALARVAPSKAPGFAANLAAFRADVMTMDLDLRARIATLSNRRLVTNHDAFGYYVAHFGLEYVGSVIPTFDSSAELSARDVADLVAKIRATGTKAVFSESSLPPKTAEAIGHEAGVEVIAGDDALFGDTLGPPGSAGDTYLKMETHNTEVIVEHLR